MLQDNRITFDIILGKYNDQVQVYLTQDFIKFLISELRPYKLYRNIQVSQKFYNILIRWSMIWQLQLLLPRLWRWHTTIYWKISSSFDTFQELLAEFGLEHSLWINAFRPTWLFAWLLRFSQTSKISWNICLLYCDQLYLHLSHKCLWLFPQWYGEFKLVNISSQLVYTACSSVHLSNHTV